jgi:pimeloyl-[acyl-carrier protein] synthase
MDGKINIDPFSELFKDNPYPIYKQLRQSAPIHFQKISDYNSFWFISEYEDIDTILKDPRFVREFKTVFPENNWVPKKEQKEIFEILQSWVLFRDPPAHIRLRKNIVLAFQKVYSEKIEDTINSIAKELCAKLVDNFDLVNDFAVPLPSMVLANLMGLPTKDWKFIKESSGILVASFDISKTPEHHKNVGNNLIISMKDYFSKWIELKKVSPGKDIISELIILMQKEDSSSILPHELMSNLFFLIVAGHETTTSLISNSILALLQHPKELEKLKANPLLINNAIEEVLRYDSPIQMTFRIASEDINIKGKTIKKGQQVALLLGSANRDGKEFESADTLNIERKNANKHLSFAAGIHYCVGANLAKTEARIAINTLIERFPNLSISKQATIWGENPSFRGLKQLYVNTNY